MLDPDLSPKTPILYQHWVAGGAFSYSPVRTYGSSRAQPFVSENLIPPLMSGEQSFVIIPLHTPPSKVQGSHYKSSAETIGRSSSSPSYSLPIARHEGSTQAHRRTPEKRLLLSPGPICRICHEGDKEETLLSPCNCSGSMELVHKSCLERWLSTSNSDRCELCMKQLPVCREARPIWQWFQMTGSDDGPQGFYADLTCVILLTPLCILSIYLCAIGAADYMRHGVWEGTGLAALSFFLMTTYLVWCFITIKFHWLTLKKWRSANQVIHLIEKECRRKPQACHSATPQNSFVIGSQWRSQPSVQLYSSRQNNASSGSANWNPPNVMDASIRSFDAPAFL